MSIQNTDKQRIGGFRLLVDYVSWGLNFYTTALSSTGARALRLVVKLICPVTKYAWTVPISDRHHS